jgi:hypothetical protein
LHSAIVCTRTPFLLWKGLGVLARKSLPQRYKREIIPFAIFGQLRARYRT